MNASPILGEPCASGRPFRTRSMKRFLRRGASSVRDLLRTWQVRAADRTALARLDEQMLRDIGLSPGDARREYSKPFWRA